ncbi:hypothetical protein SAMN05216196_1198 [Lutimaribacter pacificus]|uniref:Uncharacterized protein n=1 Tax=Lutimaribacter pacificus TaxID=391948 RepID=A0A1H0PBL8_9RHOB|nr:hypothetical protein SAMN05216196_1198 [Lutimaribacter pacificus]SHL04605.1 hypothetical protein SAMN05444142_12112 [Lutimaribacter pacificus]
MAKFVPPPCGMGKSGTFLFDVWSLPVFEPMAAPLMS